MTIKLGAIRNERFAKQLKDFSGCTFGKCSPTDIDGYLEIRYHFAFVEIKRKGTEIRHGQRAAIERAVECITLAGRPAIFLICDHEISDPLIQIDAAATVVRQVYEPGTPKCGAKPGHTLRQALEWFFGDLAALLESEL